MLEKLVLPVPETVSACYVIPTSSPPSDPVAVARAYVETRLSDPTRGLTLASLDNGLASISVEKSSAQPRLPTQLLRKVG